MGCGIIYEGRSRLLPTLGGWYKSTLLTPSSEVQGPPAGPIDRDAGSVGGVSMYWRA